MKNRNGNISVQKTNEMIKHNQYWLMFWKICAYKCSSARWADAHDNSDRDVTKSRYVDV